MTAERVYRLICGLMVLLGIVLAYIFTPLWLVLTVYTGISLLVSGLTNWSPLIFILKRMGLKHSR